MQLFAEGGSFLSKGRGRQPSSSQEPQQAAVLHLDTRKVVRGRSACLAGRTAKSRNVMETSPVTPGDAQALGCCRDLEMLEGFTHFVSGEPLGSSAPPSSLQKLKCPFLREHLMA